MLHDFKSLEDKIATGRFLHPPSPNASAPLLMLGLQKNVLAISISIGGGKLLKR